MAEIWLQANTRVFAPSIALATATASGCAVMASLNPHELGWTLGAAVAAGAVLALWLASRRPRLAFDGRSLLLRVRQGPPVAVPIELVEGFLLQKGPAFLDGRDDYHTETTTLVVRIAERAEEFRKVETNVRVAAWCGHYCTLRGTWTEPLSVDLVNRLNQRLHDVQQAAKSAERVTT
jgi:hypothetical protein